MSSNRQPRQRKITPEYQAFMDTISKTTSHPKSSNLVNQPSPSKPFHLPSQIPINLTTNPTSTNVIPSSSPPPKQQLSQQISPQNPKSLNPKSPNPILSDNSPISSNVSLTSSPSPTPTDTKLPSSNLNQDDLLKIIFDLKNQILQSESNNKILQNQINHLLSIPKNPGTPLSRPPPQHIPSDPALLNILQQLIKKRINHHQLHHSQNSKAPILMNFANGNDLFSQYLPPTNGMTSTTPLNKISFFPPTTPNLTNIFSPPSAIASNNKHKHFSTPNTISGATVSPSFVTFDRSTNRYSPTMIV